MLNNKRLISITAFLLITNITLMVIFVRMKPGEKCVITINRQSEYSTIIPTSFLSLGIDASEVENFSKINFSNARLQKLASHLAPARLRLGGTMSDRLIFSAEDDFKMSCGECQMSKRMCSSIKRMCRHKFLPFFILTGSKWEEINEFCKATNMKLLFSMNVLLRNENGWNEENAKEMLLFTKSRDYAVDFQLGNEPNSFNHNFNISVKPIELAKDFKKLHHLLNDMGFNQSLLVGPDTSSPRPHHQEPLHYMVEFLSNASNYISVISWHQYYLNSRIAHLDDFWKPETLEILHHQIGTLHNHTKRYKKIPMWLSETSSSYGGGAPGLSNSFAGTPLWVDKLGLSAKLNITTVIRQSLVGGNYSLIDDKIDPLPDWWVSVLYKKLVGNVVLNIDCKCSPKQRLYAHCTNNNYTNGNAVTIYGINLDPNKVVFLLNGSGIAEDNIDIDEYIFTAPSNNRLSKIVKLNGWPLYYGSDLPDMKPVHIKYVNQISMPPYSIGFWVVKNVSIDVCVRNNNNAL